MGAPVADRGMGHPKQRRRSYSEQITQRLREAGMLLASGSTVAHVCWHLDQAADILPPAVPKT
jgi:hypothetical protein